MKETSFYSNYRIIIFIFLAYDADIESNTKANTNA